MSPASRIRAGLLLAATLVAFTPVTLPLAGHPVSAGAGCPTCCSQPGPKCIICAEKCESVPNAYDAGTGKCPINEI